MWRRYFIFAIAFVGTLAFGMQSAGATGDQSEYAVASQINVAHTGSIEFAEGFAPPLVKSWTTDVGEGLSSYALIANDTVFVIADGVDAFALDLSTGSNKWKHKLDCCNEQGAYDGGHLFYLNNTGILTSLSSTTGHERWKVYLNGETSFPVPPIATGGHVFAYGEGDNAVAYSLKEKTGQVSWMQNIIGAGEPTLGVDGLFLASDCFYYRLDPSNGSIIWSDTRCEGGLSDPSADVNGRLYVSGGSSGTIVDASSGALIDSFPEWYAPPVLFTDARGKLRGLSISNENADLSCWNAKTGAELWEFSSGYELESAPVVVNGVIYIGDSEGTLYALNQKNGKTVWSDTLGGQGVPILTAGQDTLIVTWGTKVIAYRPE